MYGESRPKFPGEKHAFLFTSSGLRRANAMGPGTQIIQRLERGDKPISYSDGVSFIHDIDFSLAKNAQDVRNADNRMISQLQQAKRGRKDNLININIGQKGILAKVTLEDAKLVSPTTFTTFGTAPADKIPLLQKKRAELVQQGFGKKKKQKKKSGGSKKTNPWLNHVAKVKKQYPNKTYKEILTIAKKSYKKN